MEKGRIEFSITSLEPVGYSEPNGNVQIFFYIKSNCVFSKTNWKNVRSPVEKGRIEFPMTSLEPGGNSEPFRYYPWREKIKTFSTFFKVKMCSTEGGYLKVNEIPVYRVFNKNFLELIGYNFIYL